MLKNPTVTQEEAFKLITSGKTQYINFLNQQTGTIFSYKVIQSEYDPLDPYSKECPPQFIMSHIGSGEWAYMGALYQKKDYMHHEDGIFPNDYPCVKVWRYMIKMMAVQKEVGHIDIYLGEILTTDYVDREVQMDCEQVSNLQYGSNYPVIIAGKVAKELSDDFTKKKTLNQMHQYLQKQIV